MVRTLKSLLPLVLLLGTRPAPAEDLRPPILRQVGFDQKLDQQVPLDLRFRDEAGREIPLANYFHGKPVVLVLAYYRCPMLCTQVLNGLVRGLLDVPFDIGKEFDVVTVSFDPREQADLAAAKKRHYLERYGRPGAEAGWHFLTGEQDSITRLTEAVGFRYTYDSVHDQFAHASGIMILTPRGKISRYFYDITYSPRDLRLGLVEASGEKIGSPVDQILLFCFHYDPAQGKYGAAVMSFIRAGGALTLVVLGVFAGLLWRKDWRRSPASPEVGLPAPPAPDASAS